ncbi:MAG: PHP domain-containing protein [Clostridia bacterium]|nr:PHP domain-containing protein [Clostridia bacterium]MBQ9132773.1 PHP domain-containing protein [Clostridia bacterium]
MIIHSDWHIHSEYSYDASNPLEGIAAAAKKQELRLMGITDHANYNDNDFLGNLRDSVAGVTEAQKKYPFLVLGVELTPIAKPQFDYIAANGGSREGYEDPEEGVPFPIELAASKEELMKMGVRYAIGASHWRVDAPKRIRAEFDFDACIKEWYRQQVWLACDERVTILGHPWYIGNGAWYEDFSVIPRSMNMDIAAALKENGKYVECNSHFFRNKMAQEKFRHQYAEFLRELFEMGIPVTYGSDSHHNYFDARADVEKYLVEAGFKDGDISEIAEKDLW